MEFRGSFFEPSESLFHMILANQVLDVASAGCGTDGLAHIGWELLMDFAQPGEHFSGYPVGTLRPGLNQVGQHEFSKTLEIAATARVSGVDGPAWL